MALFLGLGSLGLAAAWHFFNAKSSDVAPGAKTPAANKVADASTNSSVVTTSGSHPSPRFEDFAGSEACARCHQSQYDLWKNSTHGRAGGEPGQVKVIARFDGQPLRFKDAVVTPITNARGDYVFVIEPDGAPKTEVKVDAVVGGGHMYGGGTQSFFQKFADGTMRFLPFDFIRKENLWFVQLRRDLSWVPISREISLQQDLANYPPHRVLGSLSEFSSCQNCHGSQISLRYDEQRRGYETRYQSLTINCESCHGPGKRHIALVNQPGFENLADIGMTPLATLSKDKSLLICFQCHATKDTIRDEPYLPGAPFEDFFSVKLPVYEDTFTIDGRIRSFGYQSTHLFSDCYLEGSMTCVDCHDPHAQTYRDIFGQPLSGRFDNRQCTSCHASKALAPEQHSHHKPDSPGSACTDCHMPFLQHSAVGPHLAFARSDHSIPIPRPAFDQQIGVENACQKCHRDKDLSWQEAKVKEWYGTLKPHHPMIESLLKAVNVSDPQMAEKLLLVPGAKHPIGQLAGLTSWIERFLRLDTTTPDPAVVEKLKTLAQDNDIDLRSVALMALQVGYDQRPDIHAFLVDQLQRLGEQDEAVRNRWSVTAYYFGNAYAEKGDLPGAIRCFEKSLEIRKDNIVTMSNLALAHLKRGDFEKAIFWLQSAVRLKPSKAVLHFQLAQTYARRQRVPEAIRALEEGLKYAPQDQKARRMLQELRGR